MHDTVCGSRGFVTRQFQILSRDSSTTDWLCTHTLFVDYLHGLKLNVFNIRLF